MPANPTERSRPYVPPWSTHKSSSILSETLSAKGNFAHSYLFVPRTPRDDGWLAVIHASQHSKECTRYMLIEDDMHRSGLGFTGRLLASVLLFAVRQRRVLLEVPQHNQTSGREFGRWCDQSPHTLQCAFEPWSHCALPDTMVHKAASYEATCRCIERKGSKLHKVANCSAHVDTYRDQLLCLTATLRDTPIVRLRLSTFYKHQLLWTKPSPHAFEVLRAAHRLLFHWRPWVRDLALCVMQRHGLSAKKFISVHVRISPQKEMESRSVGKTMPHDQSYQQLTQLAAEASGLRSIHLQTANPRVVRDFAAWAMRRAVNLSLVYTDHPRHESDAWGGWLAESGVASTQTAIAAVNSYIAVQAAMLLSPTASLWTSFLTHQFGYNMAASQWPPVHAPEGMPWLSSEFDQCTYSCGSQESDVVLMVRHEAHLPALVSEQVWNETAVQSHSRCRGTSAYFARRRYKP